MRRPKDPLELLAEIKARLDAAESDEFMGMTAPLQTTDFILIGRLIQAYCHSDLNARRIIDAFREVTHGADAMNGTTLQERQVWEKLVEIVGALPPSLVQFNLSKAAGSYQMHHHLRHHFAHWATRRIARRDVLVSFTMKSREGERRTGVATGSGEGTYGLAPIPQLRAELEKLDSHGQLLAKAAAVFSGNQDNVRKALDGRD